MPGGVDSGRASAVGGLELLAVLLLITGAMTGTATILEDPREPKQPSFASIWKLPWMMQLLNSKIIHRTLLYQAAYGANHLKPTHLVSCHISGFREICFEYETPFDWRQLTTLCGKTSTGPWKTAAGKEYPPMLNRALAAAHLKVLQSRGFQAEISQAECDHL